MFKLPLWLCNSKEKQAYFAPTRKIVNINSMSQLEKSSSGVTVGLTQSELMVRQFSIRYSGTTLAQPHSSATVLAVLEWGVF